MNSGIFLSMAFILGLATTSPAHASCDDQDASGNSQCDVFTNDGEGYDSTGFATARMSGGANARINGDSAFCAWHTEKLPCEIKCPCGKAEHNLDITKTDFDANCPMLNTVMHPGGGTPPGAPPGGPAAAVDQSTKSVLDNLPEIAGGLAIQAAPSDSTPPAGQDTGTPGPNSSPSPGRSGTGMSLATAGERDPRDKSMAPPRVLAVPGGGSATGSANNGSGTTGGEKGGGAATGSLLGGGFGTGGDGKDSAGHGDKNAAEAAAQGAPGGSDSFGSGGGGGRGGGGSGYGRGTGEVGTGGNSVTLYQNPAAGANDSVFDLISKRYVEIGKEM